MPEESTFRLRFNHRRRDCGNHVSATISPFACAWLQGNSLVKNRKAAKRKHVRPFDLSLCRERQRAFGGLLLSSELGSPVSSYESLLSYTAAKPHTREIFKETPGHDDLSVGLRVALGRHSHDEPREEVFHLRHSHESRSLRGRASVGQVSGESMQQKIKTSSRRTAPSPRQQQQRQHTPSP